MTFQRACALADVPEDEPLGVTVGDYQVVLARCEGEDGPSVHALQDLCSHQAVALSEGEVFDCVVECWLHGSRFDLRTGEALNLPATEPVSTFPLEIRGDDVYVDTTTTVNGVTPT